MLDVYYWSVFALGFSSALLLDACFLNKSSSKTWKWLSVLNYIFWNTVVALLSRGD